MKKILAVVEKNSAGQYSIYTPETRSVVLNGQGNTIDPAMAYMKESLKEVKDSYIKSGEKVPQELEGEIEFVYKYDIASLFDYFDGMEVFNFPTVVTR